MGQGWVESGDKCSEFSTGLTPMDSCLSSGEGAVSRKVAWKKSFHKITGSYVGQENRGVRCTKRPRFKHPEGSVFLHAGEVLLRAEGRRSGCSVLILGVHHLHHQCPMSRLVGLLLILKLRPGAQWEKHPKARVLLVDLGQRHLPHSAPYIFFFPKWWGLFIVKGKLKFIERLFLYA